MNQNFLVDESQTHRESLLIDNSSV